ncbi:membrane-spanning 4-domains subfamily A member 5-like [Sardina pilchardus]|uniref:membrane-spanning 4-domains subfamily A member 5-like n=1 Tax=Sardina pilchardus TaxID=27697 RepID=UPI002E0E45EE
MSVTMTRMEGVTVITMTSNNPKSNWPLLCQILGTLCYSPACSVSHKLRGLLGATQSALGTAQIMIGLLNIGFGSTMRTSMWYYYSPLNDCGGPFWLGALFILFGVMCILAEKCPSTCLVVITGLMNFVSAAFAVTAIVLYAINLASIRYFDDCQGYNYDYGYYDRPRTPKPPSEYEDICKTYRANIRVLLQGMSIVMIIFAVVQLCIAISAGVKAFKAVCKRETSVQDPELKTPLVDEVLSYPTV